MGPNYSRIEGAVGGDHILREPAKERDCLGNIVGVVDFLSILTALIELQVQAVKSAEETSKMVETEVQDLEKTLKNIESARPFEDCTVVSVCRWSRSCYSWRQTTCSRWYQANIDPITSTTLGMQSQRSREKRSIWSRIADSCREATGYVCRTTKVIFYGGSANRFPGKIRRLVRTIITNSKGRPLLYISRAITPDLETQISFVFSSRDPLSGF